MPCFMALCSKQAMVTGMNAFAAFRKVGNAEGNRHSLILCSLIVNQWVGLEAAIL